MELFSQGKTVKPIKESELKEVTVDNLNGGHIINVFFFGIFNFLFILKELKTKTRYLK